MKFLFAPLLEPLGAVWALMVLTVVILGWKQHWRMAFAFALPTVLFFLVGSTPLVEALVAQAERPWTTNQLAKLPQADAVVALGGGQAASRYDPLRLSMAEAGDRILAAVEVTRQGKAKFLVLGGSVRSVPENLRVPEMSLAQEWLGAWGVVRGGITNLGFCADTHAEAVELRKLVGFQQWQRVILVTSALHLRRAEAVCRKQGVTIVPLACDYQVLGVQRPPASSVFPSQDRFVLLATYLHEQIGWWVYRWRGWV